MKTIGQIIHHETFMLKLIDSQGDIIYCEDSVGNWWKKKFDDKGNETYFEHSRGYIYQIKDYENNWKHNT